MSDGYPARAALLRNARIVHAHESAYYAFVVSMACKYLELILYHADCNPKQAASRRWGMLTCSSC